MDPYISAWLLKDDRPCVVVLGNEKGGSGKSTVAIHLAMGLRAAGLKVGTVDLDGRQGTFSCFIDNRQAFRPRNREAEARTVADHRRISLSRNARESELGAEKLAQLVTALDSLNDRHYIIVDTPGSDSVLARAAHVLADILITPLNSSFLDLDALVRVDREASSIAGPSAYSESVMMMSERRADSGAAPIDWLVVVNRLPNVPTRVHRSVSAILRKLSQRLNFDFLPPLHERVIFRELYLKGLTVLDEDELDPVVAAAATTIAAREEVDALVDAVLARGMWKELAERRAQLRADPNRGRPRKSGISFANFDPSRP
ncbi:MAG: division plane positioning ATPase MipZ [Alphaproteobacteria bacterium]|nr:division plane positioning ATPase MipZ [Alphaproteobacteria bacterium]